MPFEYLAHEGRRADESGVIRKQVHRLLAREFQAPFDHKHELTDGHLIRC